VERDANLSLLTTRSPLRVNGARPKSTRAAPRVGENSAAIRAEFGL
ncbi:MAG: CoA transferase, partial [Hoeflea sp.]|nr:CoA transferase [Hoeflea sp.]